LETRAGSKRFNSLEVTNVIENQVVNISKRRE
jgi:hypothetical protein